ASLHSAPSPAVRERGDPALRAGWVRAALGSRSHWESHHRDVGSVDGFHADHVIAAIDMVDLAADPGGKIAQQVEAGAADIFDRDIALQWRVELVPLQDIAEIPDSRGGQCPDRTGRNRVDANVVAAEIDGEIAHAGLE